MMCDARLFAPQVTALGPDFDCQVSPINEGNTIEEIAAGVLAAAPAQFALCGLSMGGIVAMEIMRQAPRRVTRLALLDTNCKAETPKVAARREPQIAAVQDGGLRTVMRDEMKPHYLAPEPGREAVLDIVMDMALDLGPDVFVRQSRALQTRPDYEETLRGVSVPTLVLCGRHDALCPISRHEFMASLIRHSRLEVVERAGHLPTLEQPEDTTLALQRWLGIQDHVAEFGTE